MFWMASAKVKSETVMPRSWVIDGMNSPRLWRMPMLRLSISDAPPRTEIVCALVGPKLLAATETTVASRVLGADTIRAPAAGPALRKPHQGYAGRRIPGRKRPENARLY